MSTREAVGLAVVVDVDRVGDVVVVGIDEAAEVVGLGRLLSCQPQSAVSAASERSARMARARLRGCSRLLSIGFNCDAANLASERGEALGNTPGVTLRPKHHDVDVH